MNVIFADRKEHAEFFARHIKHWRREEYMVSTRIESFKGLRGATVWILTAPRHRPNYLEIKNRAELEIILTNRAHVYGVEVKRVTLP